MYVSLAEHARVSALQELSTKAMFTLLIRTYASSVEHVLTLALQELSLQASNLRSTSKDKSATFTGRAFFVALKGALNNYLS